MAAGTGGAAAGPGEARGDACALFLGTLRGGPARPALGSRGAARVGLRGTGPGEDEVWAEPEESRVAPGPGRRRPPVGPKSSPGPLRPRLLAFLKWLLPLSWLTYITVSPFLDFEIVLLP